MIAPLQPFSRQWIDHYSPHAQPFTGGMCNRNGVFKAEGKKYVIQTIANEVELYMMKEAYKIGVGPRIYAVSPKKKQAVIQYIKTPTITPTVARLHAYEIGAALKKAHSVPLFRETGTDIETETQTRWEYIENQAGKFDSDLSRSLLQGAEKAMQIFKEGIKKINSFCVANIHTDLHPRNLFWTNRGVRIIDWEGCAHGHPFWDISTVAIYLVFEKQHEENLLRGYFGRDPTADELAEYALIKKTCWAYTSNVNASWALYLLEQEPTASMDPPTKSLFDYQESFSTSTGMPSLEYFVNITRLCLYEAEKIQE